MNLKEKSQILDDVEKNKLVTIEVMADGDELNLYCTSINELKLICNILKDYISSDSL